VHANVCCVQLTAQGGSQLGEGGLCGACRNRMWTGNTRESSFSHQSQHPGMQAGHSSIMQLLHEAQFSNAGPEKGCVDQQV